jgi:hypothetical protein
MGVPPTPPPPAGGAPRARLAPRADPLATCVFAALVVASFAAFAITQHLKHTPTVVQNFKMTTSFSPYASGRRREEHLSFRIEHSDQVTVAILDSSGVVVATLLHDRPLSSYTQLSLEWDGRRGPTSPPAPAAGTPHDPLAPVDHGALAPSGEYRMRVSLRRQRRTVSSPRSFSLSLAAPGVSG